MRGKEEESMKRIVALVKPNMLEDVVFALHAIDDLPRATVSEVRDIGQGVRERRKESGRAPLHSLPVFARLELVCPDGLLERIVATIRTKGRTGLPDDGSIVVSAVDDVVSLS
jgi:nitrogen regulatory protein P-II 1